MVELSKPRSVEPAERPLAGQATGQPLTSQVVQQFDAPAGERIEDEEAVQHPAHRAEVWILATVPLVGALFFLSQALALDPPALRMEVSPRTFPIGVALITVLAAALMSVEAIRSIGGRKPITSDVGVSSWRDVVVSIVITTGVLWVFDELGSLLSIFILLAALACLTTPRKWVRNILMAAALSVAMDVTFRMGLGVNLPSGILGLD